MAKTCNYDVLSRKFMITCLSTAFEDFLGTSIAPQVMPPWSRGADSESRERNLRDRHRCVLQDRHHLPTYDIHHIRCRQIMILSEPNTCSSFHWAQKFWVRTAAVLRAASTTSSHRRRSATPSSLWETFLLKLLSVHYKKYFPKKLSINRFFSTIHFITKEGHMFWKKLPVKDVANSMDGASACVVFCRLSHSNFHWMSFHCTVFLILWNS